MTDYTDDPIRRSWVIDAEEEEKDSKDDIISELRKLYPNGHPHFLNMTLDELALHNNKNRDYTGGGANDPLGNFNRVSSILALYPTLPFHTPHGIAIIYLLKQMDAVLNALATGKELKVESLDERIQDIHVYWKIIRCILHERSKQK